MKQARLAAVLWLLAACPASAVGRGSLVVCDDVREPESLDPFRVFSEKTHTVLQQMLEGLLRFTPDGRLEPALAQSWERINDRTTRFHLRRGVKFNNGEEFDARSVKFSIEHYLDPKAGFPGRGFLGPLEKVVVVDDHTVDLVTKEPDGILFNRLAAWVFIVPASYASQGNEAFAREPIGTGPFRFERWDSGRAVVMRRNPDYWMRGYPKADSLEFRFLTPERQVDALLRGDIDVLTGLPGTDTLLLLRHERTAVKKQVTYYTIATSLRLNRAPLNDVRVRKALNYGLDKEDMIRYDAMGNGQPIATLTFPGEFGHNAELKPYPYDPAKARRLLAEAGFPRGLRLKALVKMNAQRTARIMARQWERIGVSLDVTPVADADLLKYFQDPSFDLAIGDVPDPAAHAFFIQSIVVYSRSPFALGKDVFFDEMLETAAATVDPGQQRERFEELDRFLYDNALSVFTYQRTKTYGLRGGVHFEASVTGMPYFYSSFKEQKP